MLFERAGHEERCQLVRTASKIERDPSSPPLKIINCGITVFLVMGAMHEPSMSNCDEALVHNREMMDNYDERGD